MIGNDIIDLQFSRQQSNWKRKGYLDKIFTSQEQLIIAHAKDMEMMVWGLWSMKEAAYKIYNRMTNVRSFMPLRLVCSQINFCESGFTGKVDCDEFVYFTKSEVNSEYIHTIAVSEKINLGSVFLLNSMIEIKKVNGIPVLNEDENVLSPVSKSHHGRFERIISI